MDMTLSARLVSRPVAIVLVWFGCICFIPKPLAQLAWPSVLEALFDLLRRECWVNASVPSDPPKLARYLGLPADEVDGALSQSVLSFFEINDGELRSPDLDQYRQILNERNKKQSDGGSNGGKITQLKRKGSLEANLQATPKASLKLLSRDEMSRDEMSKDELVLKEVNSLSNNSLDTELQEWLDDYEQSPLCQLN